jgi:molecular chaperone GrpE
MDNPKERTPAESIEVASQGGPSENDSAAPAASGAPGSPADLDAASLKLKQEKQELYDRLLRKQAELDNFRKRVQREKEDFLQHATADLIRALLPVLDGFERALAHRNSSSPEQFSQGVELIYRELLETLSRAGVNPVETKGRTFDPHLHQAVETVDTPGHRDQEIVEELQRGYRLRNRLLRPAIVKVAVEGKK